MHIRPPSRSLRIASLLATVAFTNSAMAQTSVTLLPPEALTWTKNPALPKGFESVTLVGDATKAGDMVVQRIKLPPHALVPPHTHPFAETVTVISGNVGFGMGDKVDKSGKMLPAGALYAHPEKDPHYVWTGDEGAIVQIQFIAPGGIDYINPADDPRKK
jgi:quercetin dioxygenase-like cupin family protein